MRESGPSDGGLVVGEGEEDESGADIVGDKTELGLFGFAWRDASGRAT